MCSHNYYHNDEHEFNHVSLFVGPPQPESSDTGPAACPLMVVGLIILFGFLGLIISFMLPALRHNLGFPL